MSTPHPIPPEAVRVWRGFRSSSLPHADFLQRLGTVFIPATVKMQIQCGLNAYVPTIPDGLTGKPDTVPDETAVLFWDSQQTYWDAFNTLATRTYTLTHGACYQAPVSRADFPIPFTGTLAPDQPVLLVNQPADWMHGRVQHLVAARPDGQNASAFQSAVAKILTQIQAAPGLAAAIAVVGEAYLVYWELTCHPPGGKPVPSGIPALLPLVGWNQVFAPAPTFLPVGLWDDWSGMNVTTGSSFNMQFQRRWEA